jgi:hypothetical protein
MAVPLSDAACAYLCAVIVRDLGLGGRFPEIPDGLPSFYDTYPVSSLGLPEVALEPLLARLFSINGDLDTYFSCLAQLHKSRLKYEQILQRQAFPTFDQVGPRGLLQYGSLSGPALSGLLTWRKWLYDLDNRAAQETGYLFEPILANAIGGTPVGAKRSPVKRHQDGNKGRQVDCIKGRRAYEFKLRVTIAASGQGRWSEELNFPRDCVESGYTPVLVVLDPTPNPKLAELARVFRDAGGEVFIGDDAWTHLEEQAGQVMAMFIERYVRTPLATLLAAAPDELQAMTVSLVNDGNVEFRVGAERLLIVRGPADVAPEDDEMPDDVAD